MHSWIRRFRVLLYLQCGTGSVPTNLHERSSEARRWPSQRRLTSAVFCSYLVVVYSYSYSSRIPGAAEKSRPATKTPAKHYGGGLGGGVAPACLAYITQSYVYELLYDGDGNNAPHLTGLLDAGGAG